MKPSEFHQYVARLTEECASNPAAYLRKVKRLTWIGYGYLTLLLLLALGCLGGGIFLLLHARNSGAIVYFFAAFGSLAFAIIRCLTFRYPPPEGIPARLEDFPELAKDVEAMRQTLRAPKIHAVRITPELNAAMVQQPWLGLFGFHKNYLVLGVHLAALLSRDEFRSVIAHELGHLSRTHASFNGWIYRVRLAWINLQNAFAGNGFWGKFLIGAFVNRYVPHLAAYTFVLARQNEYEADDCAARLTTPMIATAALCLSNAIVTSHSKWWEDFWKQAEHSPEPPSQACSEEVRWLQSPARLAEMNRALPRTLALRADSTDTHPSLKERLRALGSNAPAASVIEAIDGPSALDYYFPRQADEWIAEWNRQWKSTQAENWKNLHKDTVESRRDYETLLEREANAETLSEDDSWKLAALAERFTNDDTALARYRRFAEQYPQLAGAPLRIAEILWERGDPSARAYFETAARLNPQLQGDVHFRLRQMADESGAAEQAAESHAQIHAFEDKVELAQAERNSFSEKDSYYAVRLPEDELAQLRAEFAKHPKIKRVYLLGKVLQHFPENPLYVLGFATNKWSYTPGDFANKIARQLADAIKLKAQFYVFSLDSHVPKMRGVFKRFPESRIDI